MFRSNPYASHLGEGTILGNYKNSHKNRALASPPRLWQRSAISVATLQYWQTQLRRIEHVNGAGQARLKVLDAVPVTFGAMSHYQKHDRLARALFLSLFV